jgi:hypothetical protein
MSRLAITWRAALAVIGILVAAPARATPLGDTSLDVSGFVQSSYAVRVIDAACGETRACGLMLGEQRMQARLSAYSAAGELEGQLTGRIDVLHDTVLERSAIEPLELYLELKHRSVMLRAGRQVITWGSGDLLYVNDVFPKDWEAFFLGRPLEYLKPGFDSVRLVVPHAELVVAPRPESDRMPRPDRFILPASPWSDLPVVLPAGGWQLGDAEVALRLSALVSGWQLDGYAAWVHHRGSVLVPDDAAAPTALELRSPRVLTAGASVAGPFLGGIWNLEAGYQHAHEDADGDAPFIPNSTLEVFTGYARPVWSDASAGVQASLAVMRDHERYLGTLPPGAPREPELEWTFTLRLSQQLLRQTLDVGAFLVGGATRHDCFASLTARYRVTDALTLVGGANIFAGSRRSPVFGALADNTNVHLSLRYGF